ncbi:MAG: DegT/DnrJ/EryC1/StrS family aminotransferase [Acidobacteriota bacterium]
MKVPFLDLGAQHQPLESEIGMAMQEVIRAAAFASGPFVEKFEGDFARFCGARWCVGVNSGTSALHAALLAHGVGPGDEVITVPNSFVATGWAILYCGARPVFVDVKEKTFLMNPDRIEAAITPRTRVILPVHLYGQPADLEAIGDLARRHGLDVIEDAAQAHGARSRGARIGGQGNTVCFSFYPSKNLGAWGEAGAVLTPDESIASKVRLLRDHAQARKYRHDFTGFNYRMDGLQAAVLRVKLKYLQDWTDRRNAIARRYDAGLEGIDGLELPHVRKEVVSAFHLYVVHTRQRDALRASLREAGVASGLHYPIPIHLQEAFKFLAHQEGDFPAAERNAGNCLSLPLYPEMSDDQIDAVIRGVRRGLGVP